MAGTSTEEIFPMTSPAKKIYSEAMARISPIAVGRTVLSMSAV